MYITNMHINLTIIEKLILYYVVKIIYRYALFKRIYVIIGTDFCCIRVFIIIGFSKVNASPDNPDIRTEGRNPV